MDEVIRLCVVLALDILYSIVYSKFSSSIIHSSEPLSELRGGGGGGGGHFGSEAILQD